MDLNSFWSSCVWIPARSDSAPQPRQVVAENNTRNNFYYCALCRSKNGSVGSAVVTETPITVHLYVTTLVSLDLALVRFLLVVIRCKPFVPSRFQRKELVPIFSKHPRLLSDYPKLNQLEIRAKVHYTYNNSIPRRIVHPYVNILQLFDLFVSLKKTIPTPQRQSRK